MRIDGFTFFVQIINFLVLVFLLERFLYGPVVKAMREREKRIADRLGAVQRKEEEAQREARAYRERQKELEKQREAFLEKARKEADRRRRELFARAQGEAETARSRWFASITQERERLMRELRVRTGQEIFSVSRRVLKDLSGADLEVRAVKVLLDGLRSPGGNRSRGVHAGGLVLVRSSFEIPLDIQKKIIGELRRSVSVDSGVQFEVSPELVYGIEVTADGRKLSWNISDYLQDLEGKVDAVLRKEAPAALAGRGKEGAHAQA